MAKGTILVVDDEAIIVLALVQELRKAFGTEFKYETALSGEEAIHLAEELTADGEPIVACVSDWLMPGVRGDEVLLRVRDHAPLAALVLITGQADDDALIRAEVEAGVLACVKKPWRPNEVGEVIKKALTTRTA